MPFSPFGTFPSGVSLRLPPAIFPASASSCGSSLVVFLLLVAISSFLVCHGTLFLGGFSSSSVGSLSLWLLHCSLPPPLLLVSLRASSLASFGSVLAFFLFASFVTRSNLSSFATGSSLRAESPLSVVASRLSCGLGSLSACLWSTSYSGHSSLLPSTLC